jgi:oxygen-independent coproporphyrinogen-3 oxidase
VRRDVIQALMCQFAVDLTAIDAMHGIAFNDYFRDELEALGPLMADGLIGIETDRITVTSSGRLLVRAVAMIFDRLLREHRESRRYSSVI